MKKILVTAKNSYIGNAFESWTREHYDIEFISCRTTEWENKDLSIYDSIFHVAGIAHVSTNPNMESEYYRVNTDLTVKLAKKAKAEGVKQFIFMSSIIVYGESSSINKKTVIREHTIPQPSNFYGESKLRAEEGITPLQSEHFNVVVIRTPMVYGENSKGNYQTLVKLAEKLPFFPDVKNERSMIHINNLCEFSRLLIENNESGLFYPQNREYVSTSKMVKKIAETRGKKIIMTKVANPILYLLGKKIRPINKAFGSLVYDKRMSIYKEEYSLKE